jgi:hypothetical protein
MESGFEGGPGGRNSGPEGRSGSRARGRDDVALNLGVRGHLLASVVQIVRALAPGAGVALGVALIGWLKLDPTDSLGLLRTWGIWWLVAVLALVFVWDLARRVERGVARSLDRMGDGLHEMSVAVTRIADKDDRQMEELRRLSVYAAREITGVFARFDKVEELLLKLIVATGSKDRDGVVGEGEEAK